MCSYQECISIFLVETQIQYFINFSFLPTKSFGLAIHRCHRWIGVWAHGGRSVQNASPHMCCLAQMLGNHNPKKISMPRRRSVWTALSGRSRTGGALRPGRLGNPGVTFGFPSDPSVVSPPRVESNPCRGHMVVSYTNMFKWLWHPSQNLAVWGFFLNWIDWCFFLFGLRR